MTEQVVVPCECHIIERAEPTQSVTEEKDLTKMILKKKKEDKVSVCR